MPLPFLSAALIGTAANVVGNLVGAKVQASHNMKLAQYQNAYNTPAMQMARYREAGLNPNLVYTQGNPGNMTPITPANYQGAFGNLGTTYLGAEQTSAQTDLIGAKTVESEVKQAVLTAQKELINQNPLMRPEYVDALVKTMQGTAALKQQEAKFMTEPISTSAATAGEAKMMFDINNLAQKFELGTADKAIKAKILESQGFRNEILEVQKKWLKNSEITPQHIYQGILMLLSKFM